MAGGAGLAGGASARPCECPPNHHAFLLRLQVSGPVWRYMRTLLVDDKKIATDASLPPASATGKLVPWSAPIAIAADTEFYNKWWNRNVVWE